jgi:hypothetical protein
MSLAWFQWGGAATAAVLALLMGLPVKAAEDNGARPVAEELGQRTKPVAAPESQKRGGLSDSAVRVLMSYAFSIIPEQRPGPDGKPVKVDKSDPKLFLIPDEDARRIIRAATRSAYAEACQLPELAQANYETLMKTERANKAWTEQQLMMINALHAFSTSYFSGNVKISEGGAPNDAAKGTTNVSKDAAPDQGAVIDAPARPQCPPEQKLKVQNSINAYVQSAQSAQAPAPQAAPAKPAVPAVSGSN